MSAYIQPILGLQVEKAQAGSLATPSAKGDGVAIDAPGKSWSPRSGAGYPKAAIALNASGNATVSNARLLAYGPYGVGGANQWMVVAPLNNGDDITLTSTVGFIQQMNLPSVFTALAVDGTVSANNVGYTATPMSVLD
jgi:hypothetical protein